MKLSFENSRASWFPTHFDKLDQSIMYYYYLFLLHSPWWCYFWQVFPFRGLTQDDPLSPFLFILGSEIISRLLLREENFGSLHNIKIARMSPSIYHLLFANDVMIFSKANVVEANIILKCLTSYFLLSRQCINQH